MHYKNNFVKFLLSLVLVICMFLDCTVTARASTAYENTDDPDEAVLELLTQIDEYSFAQNCFNAYRVIKSVNSDPVYDDCKLTWQYASDAFYDVLIGVIKNGTVIDYGYDGKLRRVSKTVNGDTTYFEYDEWGNVTREYDGNKEVIYLYEEVDPRGLIYEGKEYKYEIEDGLITGIMYGEKTVAKYTYSGGILEGIYKVSKESVEVDSDPDFIGNINKIRYNGWYCDEETGWRYSGRYFDPKKDRFIDGKSREEMEPLIEQYGYSAELITQINDFYSDGGVSAYAAAPSKEEQIKTIATVIYGESHDNVIDQLGVAQVIQNRMHSSDPFILYGGITAYELVTARTDDGYWAFGAYVDTSYEDMMKYSGTQVVSHALENARRLYDDVPLIYHLSCYDDFTFFCSVNRAYKNIYRQNGSWYKSEGNAVRKLKKVYLSNYGEITSTTQLKAAYGNGQPGNNKYFGKNNIFFQYAD